MGWLIDWLTDWLIYWFHYVLYIVYFLGHPAKPFYHRCYSTESASVPCRWCCTSSSSCCIIPKSVKTSASSVWEPPEESVSKHFLSSAKQNDLLIYANVCALARAASSVYGLGFFQIWTWVHCADPIQSTNVCIQSLPSLQLTSNPIQSDLKMAGIKWNS